MALAFTTQGLLEPENHATLDPKRALNQATIALALDAFAARAVEAEREACAALVEKNAAAIMAPIKWPNGRTEEPATLRAWGSHLEILAAAIRERGRICGW